MASVYTLSSVGGSTPVELTGGRVGNFKLFSNNRNLRIGASNVTSSTGVELTAGVTHTLAVTSPDEIYVISVDTSTDVTIFHNR